LASSCTPCQHSGADLIILFNICHGLLWKIVEVKAAFLIEQFALLKEARALAVSNPLGKCSIIRALFLRYCNTLLKPSDIPFNPPICPFGTAFGFQLLLFFRLRETVGPGIGFVKVALKPFYKLVSGIVFHRINVVFKC